MRLKQLLGTILLGMSAVSMAVASDSQLSGVLVKSHDNAGVVTILASGTFTHTEYRPTDTVMLVDLAGVSLPQQDAKLHSVYAPGVRSYRIQSYRSPSGSDVARIELNLMPGARAQVSDVTGGLQIEVSGASAVPSPKEIAALADRRMNAASAGTSSVVASSAIAHISNVAVTHSADGVNIEIAGSGPMTAKTMKLTGPDRLVVDIPNSVLVGHNRAINVNNGEVKTVRAAHYQDDPPATRVVVDLAAMRDFEVAPAGNKLIVKLHDSARLTRPATQPSVMDAATKAPAAVTTTIATASQPRAAAPIATNEAKSAEPKPERKAEASSNPPAQNFVVVSPTFSAASDHPAGTDNATPNAKVVEASASRAEVAASRFAQPTTTVASNNQPPFGSASLSAKPAAINAALQAQQAAPQQIIQSGPAVGNCTSGRYNGEPIGMNFKDLDLKDFFRVIHEISGLNVVLDPAVKGSVTIVLDDVPWDQALAIVLNNNGLECQLQGNVLRIATLETLKTEAEARRAQQEAQALAVPKQTITRYMSYGQSKDAVLIIKKFLSPRGDVVADPRSNALIIEDIPAALEKIDPLLRTLDRKTPEVEIEARVVAATRSFARDIGTQLGFGFADGHTAVGGATQDGPIKVTNTSGDGPFRFIQGTTAGTIPLFSNLPATSPTSGVQVSTTTFGFRLDYILTMAESRGLLKILSRPHIVTQNNILALIKQGTRVPVVTNQQLGGPPTVTYIDAFLRLSVTPQITAENTIFLNVDVENTV
ncbi:MAG TPA: AMIN domain-containing protein, partial [Candidatus Limnocylindrales bacterium]|nr:AMIN domain-containing protein [Candidatus Limnocylindrales bacterium]